MRNSDVFARTIRLSKATLWLLLLVGMLACGNCIALLKADMRDCFALMNQRTVHNLVLIDFVNSRPLLVVSYFLVFWSALAFSIVRRHPAWSRWLICLAF